MTLIGAIKVPRSNPEYIVSVADGRETKKGGSPCDYSSNKVASIGNKLILGCGDMEEMRATFNSLRALEALSTSEIAKRASNFLNNFDVDKNRKYIVAGQDDNKLRIYCVDHKGSPENKEWPLFAGSGGREQVSKHLFESYNPEDHPTDLAEGLMFAYQMAMVAQPHKEVDDKLQFGVISKEGTLSVFHPEVTKIDPFEVRSYLGQFPGSYDEVLALLKNAYRNLEGTLNECLTISGPTLDKKKDELNKDITSLLSGEFKALETYASK